MVVQVYRLVGRIATTLCRPFLRHGPKRNRLHFTISTRPNAQADRQRRAGGFKTPPQQVRRDGSRVEGCDEEVEEVDG